jgi:hypothetical protein
MSNAKNNFTISIIEDKDFEESLSKCHVGSTFIPIEEKNECIMISGMKDVFKQFKSSLKSYQNTDQCEVYSFNRESNRFSLINTKGKTPKSINFFKSINIEGNIYSFGGLTIGSKSEFKTTNDFNCFNTNNSEWIQITPSSEYPSDRFEFSFNKIVTIGILYGGISLPKEIYLDDLWLFDSQTGNWINFDTSVK